MNIKPFEFNDEIWLPITDLIVKDIIPNRYIVSNYGYVASIDSYNNYNLVHTEFYHGQFNNRPSVNLQLINRSATIILSRIVAKAFCPGYAEGLEVNHIDGNPLNNYYKNLEWVNRSENIRHAYDNNLIKSLIDKDMVIKICKLLEEDELSAVEIADITGLSKISNNPISLISAIKKGVLWKHISKDYIFPSGRHDRLFSDDQIHEICKLLEINKNMSAKDILNHLGIEFNSNSIHKFSNIIAGIRHKRKYTNISKEYSF